MSIRLKLLLSFLACAGLVLGVGAISTRQFWHVNQVISETKLSTLAEVQDTNLANRGLLSLFDETDDYINVPEKRTAQMLGKIQSTCDEIDNAVNGLLAESHQQLASAKTADEIGKENAHLANVESISVRLNRFRTDWGTITQSLKDTGQVDHALITEINDHIQSLMFELLALQQEAQDQVIGTLDATGRQMAFCRNVIISATSLAFCFALAVGWIVATRLVRRLWIMRGTTGEIGNGNLAARLAVNGSDEIDALAGAFNDMAAKLSDSRDQMTQATELAERASRVKSSFLANMSHEIRTPITAIVGYSDMLLEPDQTLSDRQDYLQVIRRSARHLLELINNILDISKIEAGKMSCENAPADFPQMVGDVASILRPKAIDKGLGFHVVFDGAIPRTIRTDALRVRQILMNLLSNALKFTERGEIRLRISCTEGADDSSQIRFDVSDSGIGMSDDQIATLFRPFTQADESMTRRFGGTGLGLAISLRLSRLLGGDLTAKSLIGVGSTFTSTIAGGSLKGIEMLNNLTEATLATTPMDQTQTQRISANILLAEDGVDNQRLITLLLRKAGAQVTVVENGRLAVDLVCNKEFDLVLMDMQMPEMDGYAATSELRSRGKTLPIIALTAHALAEDRAKCLAAGCSDYLTKPVRKETLINTIAKYVKQPETATASTAQPSASAPTPAAVAPAGPLVRSSYLSDADMQEIISLFVADLPKHVERMEELLMSQDLEGLRRVVHQLKGSGGGYGFAEITTRAAEAERSIKSADPIQAVERQVKSLIELIKRVEGFSPQSEDRHGTKTSAH